MGGAPNAWDAGGEAMGFMDKFKDAARQAQDAAQQGMDPANIGVAADVNRIGNEGIETRAILKSLTKAGEQQFGGGTEYQMELEVQPEGGEPYPATINQQLIDQSVAHYEQNIGGEVKVKVDPNDPDKMVLWG
jgi:hypothetical protein